MNILFQQIRGKWAAVLLFFPLLAIVVVGCGTNSSATSGSPSVAATATACAQRRTTTTTSFKTVTGTLKSSSATTLVVTTQQGTDVSVNYSSTTRFTQQKTVPTSSLKEGTAVTVLVSSANNTYDATRISLTGSGNGTSNSPFPRGTAIANNPCFSLARRSGGFGGQFGGTGTGTTSSNFRGLIGTVSQLNGNTLIVTDSSGTDYTVTITPQTQVIQTVSATAAALKPGTALIITGSTGKNGTFNARTVSITAKLPANATATPTT